VTELASYDFAELARSVRRKRGPATHPGSRSERDALLSPLPVQRLALTGRVHDEPESPKQCLPHPRAARARNVQPPSNPDGRVRARIWGRQAAPAGRAGGGIPNDSIDRLTSETVTGTLSYAKTFAYDPVGNRLTQTTAGAVAGTVNYAYDVRDRLTTENTTSYTYDADGNVASKAGEATYGWDFESRLGSASMSSGAIVTHVYDPDGNRVQTSVTPSGGAATTTNMLVDTVGSLSQVVAETDGSGNLATLYVRAVDELLAAMRPGSTPGTWNTRFVHHDGLGSVRALTDETGTTADTRGYEAFGMKNVEAGNDSLAYGFAGEPFQTATMLAYHRARWMDERVGRFLGMDAPAGHGQNCGHRVRFGNRSGWPNAYIGGVHAYIYADDEPADFNDPSGYALQYPTADSAADGAFFFLRIGNARGSNVEWGTVIYYDVYTNTYSYTEPESSGRGDAISTMMLIRDAQPLLDTHDYNGVAVFHTHPDLHDPTHDPEIPSPDDRQQAVLVTNAFFPVPGVPPRPKMQAWGSVYLGTPSGRLLRFDDYPLFHGAPTGGQKAMSMFNKYDIQIHGSINISVDIAVVTY
jgi:RHS repeat-associated protein